jgi:hypothetical protein
MTMAASHPMPVGMRLMTMSQPRPSTLRMAPITLGRTYRTRSPAISAPQKMSVARFREMRGQLDEWGVF